MQLPNPLTNLLEQFSSLPGIGPRTAERLVFWLLKRSPASLTAFARVLENASHSLTMCVRCHNIAEKSDICLLCSDSKRDSAALCVVADIPDLLALEKTGAYHGLYHVLCGVLDPLAGITPESLTIDHLKERLAAHTEITELIFALNPDTQGEVTSSYIQKFVARPNLTITRLARGLPQGSDVEYADEVTLAHALTERR